jgi:hypothetical protein
MSQVLKDTNNTSYCAMGSRDSCIWLLSIAIIAVISEFSAIIIAVISENTNSSGIAIIAVISVCGYLRIWKKFWDRIQELIQLVPECDVSEWVQLVPECDVISEFWISSWMQVATWISSWMRWTGLGLWADNKQHIHIKISRQICPWYIYT